MESSDHGKQAKGLNIFEKYLTLWVALCIVGGIALGKVAPGFAESLDKIAIYVDGAPIVSIRLISLPCQNTKIFYLPLKSNY